MDKNDIENLKELYKTIKILRDPDGCPWDSKQTSKSLLPYLLEETHEVIEAIEEENISGIKEELGDMLLHLIFQSQIYEEKDAFNFSDIIEKIDAKLKNRHPELFGIENENNGLSWEEKKQNEKKRKKFLDGVPISLPALTRASRIQEKAAQVGFDWQNIGPIWDKVYEEIDELKTAISSKNEDEISEELGDVLFSIVNLSRHLNINSEVSLDKSIIKFISRFKKLENHIKEKKLDFKKQSLSKLDKLWNEIKINEKSNLK